MFSRRHYIAIARVMQDSIPRESGKLERPGVWGTRCEQWAKVRDTLIELFETDNEAFDEARFVDACGAKG